MNEDRNNKWTNLARTKTTPSLCKCKLYLVSSKTAHLRFFFNYFSIQKKLILIKFEELVFPHLELGIWGQWIVVDHQKVVLNNPTKAKECGKQNNSKNQSNTFACLEFKWQPKNLKCLQLDKSIWDSEPKNPITKYFNYHTIHTFSSINHKANQNVPNN